jgi:hypothetical protein
MKELEKLIMALYKNNHNLLRLSSPVKEPPYSLYRRLGGPQNWSGRRGEEIYLAPGRNPIPAVHPYAPPRRQGHSSDKNGVYSTFIFHLISVFSCFNYEYLLLPTSPSCNFDCTKRTIFPWKRVLRADPE